MRNSMISVNGLTYRISRVRSGVYEAFRLIDDLLMGTFSVVPSLRLEPVACDERMLRNIARVALREAKTSWVGVSPVACSEQRETRAPILPGPALFSLRAH